MTTQKKPAKPKPPKASTEKLLEHYNLRVEKYNSVLNNLPAKKMPVTGLQKKYKSISELALEVSDKNNEVVSNPTELQTRNFLIKIIKRQNFRLGKPIKARAIELLLQHRTDPETGEKIHYNDKYTSGLAYQQVLEILWEEFPEASTSVACLRWYVVHMRAEANDEGVAWPDLPSHRLRSPSKKRKK